MWRTFVLVLALVCSIDKAASLDITAAVDSEEKLVYLNLWGKVMPGDDKKFRALVLPYIRSGHLLFKVNVFTPGGDVLASMGIGNQIRLLEAMTVAPTRFSQYVNRRPVLTNNVECWFWSNSRGKEGLVADNWPNQQFKRDIETDSGASWCDCASSCFFIWASGIARTGNWVGIHRFTFNELPFGQLSPTQARTLYTQAEREYRAYLNQLDVPQSIIEKLFATPSTAIHYLTKEELELAKSTPYLEEQTQARCGSSKARGWWEGDDHLYKEDPVHIDCYRTILKDLMREGAKNYLSIDR
jgi:hypothetical protein